VGLKAAHFDRYDRVSFLRAHAELVAAGVDGILMAPVLSAAAVEALEASPGMPHVVFDTELDHPLVASSIGQDSYRSGRLAARLMRLCMGGPGRVAIMAPDADNRHIGERVRGIREELGSEAEIAVSPHESRAEAYAEVLDSILGAAAGPRGLIVADATTRIAASAIEAMSLRGIKLIGFDLQEEDAPFLESGAIDFLITQAPRRQGELGLRQLFRLLVLAEACEARIAMPIDAVTRENYAEHLESRGA
jgi:LacI family transcriptional regulator